MKSTKEINKRKFYILNDLRFQNLQYEEGVTPFGVRTWRNASEARRLAPPFGGSSTLSA